jgi:ATP-dependent Lon protease
MLLHPVKDTLPLLPIRDHVLFPNLLIPLTVSRPASVAAVEAALAREDKVIAIFTQKDPKIEEPKSGDIYTIGTLAVIKKMIRIEQVLNVIVQGIQRAELVAATTEKPFLNVTVNPLPEPQDWNTEIEASHRAMIGLSEKMLDLVDPHDENQPQLRLVRV